jgi:hypothetical protein
VTLSSWDDFPVHQAPEFIAHPGTSDRNFYDRYYFNMHPSSDQWFAIFGFGQYPNLGVVDAFIDVRYGETQHIVRASAPMTDRSVVSVGPIRIEVLEPLRRLRVVVEPTEHGVAMDVTWEGHIPALAEPLSVGGTELGITPDRCWGTRDRSWGIRPVGEPETDGIRQGELVLRGMWNYFPMQFEDHTIMYICHEQDDGARPLVQGERVWADEDRPIEDLGRSEHAHHLVPGTRVIDRSVISFPDADLEIVCTPLLTNYVSIGTGYGIDADWRHGMYHGPDPVVQGLTLPVDDIKGLAQYGIVDHVARFTYKNAVGYGLLEHGFFGPYHRYGLTDGGVGAPPD